MLMRHQKMVASKLFKAVCGYGLSFRRERRIYLDVRQGNVSISQCTLRLIVAYSSGCIHVLYGLRAKIVSRCR